MSTAVKKVNLLDLNREGMRELFASYGEKPFRADQVMKWMYHFGVDKFDEMIKSENREEFQKEISDLLNMKMENQQ